MGRRNAVAANLEVQAGLPPWALTHERPAAAPEIFRAAAICVVLLERTLPDVGLMAALAACSIGLEIMSTPAACRTFNVLLGEQRRVVAALFNPSL